MNKFAKELYASIVEGLRILQPYIGELDVECVPQSYPNGTAQHSHQVVFSIILGSEDPTVEETMKLKTLGWVFDGEYVSLYHPNIYEVPTIEELKVNS